MEMRDKFFNNAELLDDDSLENVNGGVGIHTNLVCKDKDKKKAQSAVLKNQSASLEDLLLREDKIRKT